MRISDWSSDLCSSDLGIRAVSVITRDGKKHLIPNENLMTQEVENWSFSSRDVRIHVSVGISYDADVHRAQELMLEAARACPRVLSTPEPLVWIRAFGERPVEFDRSEEHTSELQSLMRNSYAVFCLKIT